MASLLGVDPDDGQARHVHRDHPRRDPRGLRPAPCHRPAALRCPGGPPHPRPAGRVPHLAHPVEAGPPGLSAGRVQSVAVRLIVEREREIRAFVPVEYWSVDVRLTPGDEPEQPFIARLTQVPEGKLAASPEKKGVLLAEEAGGRARRAPAPRGVPRHERREEGAQALAGAAVHDLDPAAGSRAQARVRRPQDDDARPAPLRRRRPSRRGHGRAHHLHANRLGEHRRHRAARGGRAREDRVRRAVHARRAPPVQDARPQRAGSARGRATHERDAHAGEGGRHARSRPAAPVHPDLAAHDGHADGRGALRPGRHRHRGGVASNGDGRRSPTACVPPARR